MRALLYPNFPLQRKFEIIPRPCLPILHGSQLVQRWRSNILCLDTDREWAVLTTKMIYISWELCCIFSLLWIMLRHIIDCLCMTLGTSEKRARLHYYLFAVEWIEEEKMPNFIFEYSGLRNWFSLFSLVQSQLPLQLTLYSFRKEQLLTHNIRIICGEWRMILSKYGYIAEEAILHPWL